MSPPPASLLAACRAWTSAHDDHAREEIRQNVRAALLAANQPDGRIADFDAAIAAASGAKTETAAHQAFRNVEPPPPPKRRLPKPLVGAAWRRRPAPREWLVQGWLPRGALAMLSGPGENGKSLLALQLACALACDRQVSDGAWLASGPSTADGIPTLSNDQLPVVIAAWEDGPDEFLARRWRFADDGSCRWAVHPSIEERLLVQPMAGQGPLWAPTKSGHIATVGEPTAAALELCQRCEEHHAALLVLDPLSLAIATSENDRALVSIALEWWSAWARRTQCTVLMIGHPSKTTEGEGAAYSGSTAWRGLCRAMWTLREPKPDKADKANNANQEQAPPDPNDPERVAELTLNKCNYSRPRVRTLLLRTTGHCASWELSSAHTSQPKATPVKPKATSGPAATPAKPRWKPIAQ